MANPSGRSGRELTKRELILAAATTAFAGRPYDAVSVGEVARHAGVAHGLVFHHFKDKRGLYIATISRLLADLDRYVASRPGELTADEQIRCTVGRYLEFIARYPAAMLSLLRIGQHEPDLQDPYLRARRIGLARILDPLEISWDDLTPRMRMALSGWMACADAMAADWLANRPETSIETCVELTVDALVAAMRSGAGHSSEPVWHILKDGAVT